MCQKTSEKFNLMLKHENKNKTIKKSVYLIFVLLFSINSIAAIVGDNNGAAFTTKAEFEELKENFASQLDNYNTSIDKKIDGAIAQYLAGIKLQTKETENLMLWGGRKLGLIENEKSRPYVEGNVGGRLDFTLYSCSGGRWYSGITTANNSNTTGTNPAYFKTCFHRMSASSTPFKYLIVDVNKTGSDYYFNLLGYASVVETINGLHRTHKNADLTQRSAWTVGFCSGFYSQRGALEDKYTSYTGNFAQFCETTARTSSRGSYAARGTAFDDHHNEYMLTWNDITITSEPSIQNTLAYITNSAADTAYDGIRTRDWHGINATNGTTETHTSGEMHMFGWNLDSRGTKFNFHIDARFADNVLFNDGAGCFDRIIQADPSYSSGSQGHYPNTMAHGTVSDDMAYKNLFKADIGGELTSSNIYSSELASAISDKVKTGLIKKSFNGVEQDVSPLYLGLPITDVKQDDIVEIELDLLDNSAAYDIAFTVDGFKNEPISASLSTDAGCKVDGFTNHIANFPTSRTESKQKIKVEIEKTGCLFMKYGATGGTSQYIQLPLTCTITKN